MKAKGDWILVCRRAIPNEVLSTGGVIIPQIHEDEYFEGVVHSVGEFLEDLKINKGDYVLMRNAGNKIKVGSVKAGEIYALEYDDLIAVVGDDEEVTSY